MIVCTPPVTHADIACHFLRRGIHVLCEKPLSIDLRGARLMALEAARGRGPSSPWPRSSATSTTWSTRRSLIASGAIGEVVLFENVFTARVDMAARWNSDPAVCGGGVLIDNGTHSVDLMRYFLGALAEVQAVEGQRIQGLPVEDTVACSSATPPGVLGSIDLSWSVSKETDSYLTVYGTEGTIAGRLAGVEVAAQPASGDWTVFGAGYDKVGPSARQLDNFARAIRGEEELAGHHGRRPRLGRGDRGRLPRAPASRWTAGRRFHRRRRPRVSRCRRAMQLRTGPGRAASCAMSAAIHPTAIIEEGVELGAGTAVWDNVHIRHGARLGDECIVGEKTYIAYGVRIGHRVKINAMVYICSAVTIEDGVMVSAGTVFTNDRFPRATTPDLQTPAPLGAGRAHPARPSCARGRRSAPAAPSAATCDRPLRDGRHGLRGDASRSPDFHLAVGNPARAGRLRLPLRPAPAALRTAGDARPAARRRRAGPADAAYDVRSGGEVQETGCRRSAATDAGQRRRRMTVRPPAARSAGASSAAACSG